MILLCFFVVFTAGCSNDTKKPVEKKIQDTRSVGEKEDYQKKQEAEDAKRRQEQAEAKKRQEEEAKKQDRRNRFYGTDAQSKRYKRRPHIYLFRADDLDNDDVISAVESTPTYKRTREILDSIYSQASGEEQQQKSGDAPAADFVQGTIKFG